MRPPLLALLAVLLTAPAAPAASFTFVSTPNAALADGAGDDDAFATFDTIDTSVFFGPGFEVTDVSIEVMLDHTWVGDLAIELVSPGGLELQVLARPGSTIGDEQTGAPWGDSSNLDPGSPITFSDAGTASAETLGQGVGGGSDVPAGSYTPDADGWSSDIASFQEFWWRTAGGDWTLRVGDYANADTGTLVEWRLHLTAAVIPEPSTGALVGLGLAALAASRRQPAEARSSSRSRSSKNVFESPST